MCYRLALLHFLFDVCTLRAYTLRTTCRALCAAIAWTSASAAKVASDMDDSCRGAIFLACQLQEGTTHASGMLLPPKPRYLWWLMTRVDSNRYQILPCLCRWHWYTHVLSWSSGGCQPLHHGQAQLRSVKQVGAITSSTNGKLISLVRHKRNSRSPYDQYKLQGPLRSPRIPQCLLSQRSCNSVDVACYCRCCARLSSASACSRQQSSSAMARLERGDASLRAKGNPEERA